MTPDHVEPTEAPLVVAPEPPSQLALALGASVEAATKRRARGSAEPKRKSRCPSSIDPQAPTWLARWGIPALSSSHGAEVAKMLDQHTAKGNLFLDWLAVWRTWDRNADSFGKRAHGPAAGHRPRSEPTRAPAAPEERPSLAPEANAAKAAALMRDLGNVFAMNRKHNGTVTR